MESITTSTNEKSFSKIVKVQLLLMENLHMDHTARMKTLYSKKGSLNGFNYVNAITKFLKFAVHLCFFNVWRVKGALFKKKLNLTKLCILGHFSVDL